ncbi:methyltransferase domain-containing protein [Flindersiella endophytica]
MLITSRSFVEYQAMFDLSDTDLELSILDCCAGASGFTAELAARGGSGAAVDPAYGRPQHEVLAAISTSASGAAQLIDENQDRFVWSWYGTPARRDQLRAEAAGRFARDYVERPHAYVAGALPDLPFGDGAFDLVLCSHLLFTWADRLGEDWHRAALRELARVARREVRVFPLVLQGAGEPVEFLDRLAGELGAERRAVPYEFQAGADQMLVIAH